MNETSLNTRDLPDHLARALVFIEQHPQGVTSTDMRHLFAGDRSRASTAGQDIWKLGLIRKKPRRRREYRDGMGYTTVKRIVYYPKNSKEGIG